MDSISFKEPSRTSMLKNSNPTLFGELFDGRKSRHCFQSDDGKFLYHIGIIDYLQDFNIEKYGENKFKSIISDGDMISAVPPIKYCKRFFNFM